MTTQDLVQWLREQIAEKRQRAMRTAFLPDGPPAVWLYLRDVRNVVAVTDDHAAGVASRRATRDPNGVWHEDMTLNDADGEHMELNDPQAAVAECDAHTAILNLHPLRSDGSGLCNECSDPYPCGTVRAVALAHRHRPDYLEEWRP